jgi:hypothetical protein
MLEKIKDAVSSRISPTREHWSGLRDDLRGRLRGLRNNREAGQQKELEADFTRLLAAWGIEEETAIPGIITDLQIRCLILATPVLLAAVLTVLAQSFAVFLSLVFITPPCLFGFLTTLWRISVLERRAFTPFCRWLVNGLTRKTHNQRSSS